MRLTSDSLVGLRGPLLLISLCATPLVIWAFTQPFDIRFQGRYLTLTSLAVLLALAGTSAFALNLVLGAGAAGLRAAIELAERGVEVLCVGKRRRDDPHTVLASGGINAALGTMDPEDGWQQHAADTLREGYWLSNPASVEILAREAPRAIDDLVRWGARFAREEDGRLTQRFFGAHRHRRTCFAGDYGSRWLMVADAVVLAAGGHTRIWRRSSSRRDENTGDAMRLAAEAGARLKDMELVQFHPTGMVYPEESAGTLVTEAVRGEGGILRNALGERV